MFDEPDGMGYANGGLVAFAKGGEADEEDELTLGDRLREQFRGPEDPTYYGRPMTAADMRGAFGIPEPVKVKPELPTLGDRLREQFRGPEDPTYYGRPMTARDMRGTFGIPEPKKEGPPPAKSKPSMPGSRGVFYVNGAFVDAGGEPVSPPKPGAKVPIGAQRLIGGGIVPSGRSYTVPTNDPAYRGLPVSAGDMRKTFGNPEGYVPFGGEGTGISRLLGGLGDESFAAKEFQKATAQYYRDRAAYDAIRDRNARIAAIGGGKPQPLPPKPVMPKQSDFKAAPKAKPAASAAKPSAPAPRAAAAATPAGILDLSGGQSRESVPRGTLYRDPQGNIRRNDNGDKGNPIVTPAPRAAAAATPAGPRVAGPAPAGPRPAPAGPRPSAGPRPAFAGPRPAAGPALSASPAAVPGAGGPPPPTGAAAVLAELEALAPQDRTMRDTMAKRYAEMSSPEALAAQKKQDFWGSLAQIGFGMAGSNSPYFLQAAGQAASAALPGMQQAAHARKAQEMAGLQGRLGIENLTNQERQQLAGRAAELSEMRRKGQIDEQQFNAQMELKREELAVDREYKRGMVAAAGARGSGGGRAQATGAKPLTMTQAMAMVGREMSTSRDKNVRNMTIEQQVARARAIVAASSGEAAPTTAPDYTYVNGKLVPTNR